MNIGSIAIFEDIPQLNERYAGIAEDAGFVVVSSSLNFVQAYDCYYDDSGELTPNIALVDAQMPWVDYSSEADEVKRQYDIYDKYKEHIEREGLSAGDIIVDILRRRFGDSIYIIGNSSAYSIEGSDISANKGIRKIESILTNFSL